MTKPATDEEITQIEATAKEWMGHSEAVDRILKPYISLIARVKSEREQTIRECINAIATHQGGEFDDQGLDTAVTILDVLLEPKA